MGGFILSSTPPPPNSKDALGTYSSGVYDRGKSVVEGLLFKS